MPYTIIDCHTHVYPDKIAQRAADSIGAFYGIPMALDGTVDSLLATSEEAGVSRCLICSAAVDAQHVSHVNDFLIRTVHAHPDRLLGFGTLHPDMDDVEGELERILSHGLLGVKLHPDMQKFSLADEKADRLYAACEGKCPMLLHTGDKRYHYSNPILIPPILRKHPNLKLICAHLGGYSEWEEAAQCLYAEENVYVDCSSSFFGMSRERARALIELYGEDRVLFGSDYPMWNAKEEKEILLSLGLSDHALQKIFSENLLKLLGNQ